ncbi:DUF6879 family protein [Nonomuraea typhae]|uniref:DUF6879 family protein n=1 Tax=Nonomuraea typhae TaxID=2603600 RepID=UPI001FE50AEB|nr:DUF6879 family protein [Nonomuraea typhae]
MDNCALKFVGLDPDTPDEECPAVFVDPITGDLFFQGRIVTDPEILKRFAEDAPIGDDEAVVWQPKRMRPIIADALSGTYAMDVEGPGAPTFAALLASTKRSAVHLEMRDVYDESDPAYQDFLAGGPGTYDRSKWTGLVSEAVSRGVVIRRLRIISEPVTPYIRWEHRLTPENISAGEDVRWLPRKRAYDLLLPGADLWMFDQRLVRFHHNAGDGRSLKEYEFVSDPRRVAQTVGAFEMAWERAIPHDGYKI